MEFHKLALAVNYIYLLSSVYVCSEKIFVIHISSHFPQANHASGHILNSNTTFFVVFVLPILKSVIACGHTLIWRSPSKLASPSQPTSLDI